MRQLLLELSSRARHDGLCGSRTCHTKIYTSSSAVAGANSTLSTSPSNCSCEHRACRPSGQAALATNAMTEAQMHWKAAWSRTQSCAEADCRAHQQRAAGNWVLIYYHHCSTGPQEVGYWPCDSMRTMHACCANRVLFNPCRPDMHW